jgi:hypothetical protein
MTFLNDQDMADLTRFIDVLEDGEGYDIPSERMKRLAELGVVRRRYGDCYSITSFGRYVLKDGPAEFLALPLKTSDEFNAAQNAALRQRLDAARAAKGE